MHFLEGAIQEFWGFDSVRQMAEGLQPMATPRVAEFRGHSYGRRSYL